MSAVAAAAVRRGLRMAFPRASSPGVPRQAASGRPMAPVTSLATTGPRATTPTVVSRAPRPTAVRTRLLGSCVPTATTAAPAVARMPPAAARAREEAGDSAAVPRNAWSGGTRDARRAGRRPAPTVTTTPAIRDTATEVPVTTRPPAGRWNPKLSKSPFRSPAMPSPASRPSPEARVPMLSASMTTEPRTWRRVPPRARSRAASRLRWAMRIVKVLEMDSVATSNVPPQSRRSWPRAGKALSAVWAVGAVSAVRGGFFTARESWRRFFRCCRRCDPSGRRADPSASDVDSREACS